MCTHRLDDACIYASFYIKSLYFLHDVSSSTILEKRVSNKYLNSLFITNIFYLFFSQDAG